MPPWQGWCRYLVVDAAVGTPPGGCRLIMVCSRWTCPGSRRRASGPALAASMHSRDDSRAPGTGSGARPCPVRDSIPPPIDCRGAVPIMGRRPHRATEPPPSCRSTPGPPRHGTGWGVLVAYRIRLQLAQLWSRPGAIAAALSQLGQRRPRRTLHRRRQHCRRRAVPHIGSRALP